MIVYDASCNLLCFSCFSAQITAMKKSIPKTDKKKKKEINDEIERLELEMAGRHEMQLSELSLNDENASQENKTDSILVSDISCKLDDRNLDEPFRNESTKISKAQRKRNKKAAEKREQQQRIEAESKELEANSPRKYEQDLMKIILKREKLKIYDIPSDGDCLYKAIEHQLSLRGRQTTVSELRKMCANQLRKRRDEFLPFMINPDCGDIMTSEGFEKYCDQVEKTKCWGGDLEIKALSYALSLPVKVFQAFGSHVEISLENYKNSEPLMLSYHRHAFQLGEHYNSLIKSER